MTEILDETDRRLLRALDARPRATVQSLAEELRLARGTVQARLARIFDGRLLDRGTSRMRPAAVGRPMRAIVTAEVDQSRFDGLIPALAEIPEVVECLGVAGASDLSIEIVAADPDDVYRVTQRIMECPGIRRTSTSIVLRELLARRLHQLL
ncbi:Lrp/AsnC family transcriptional regulator [Homoserinibacter sp. YIM 151385]|uniref:Lrp/AsnC family transcriptional regulator n=1 Tax=Homoserinibacter sp. YIM 151385 TaxID=2985506 RepID=UPI0022EFF446|nr:Lrp/AsnC family transcriptional regulator [Homoserinibacter sp. YIM 151385]WBU37894.1 Lrp/AsnC family transcriptional regulator [Homoserinibacter sp. YIM 151385]